MEKIISKLNIPSGKKRRKKGYLKSGSLIGIKFGRLKVLSKYKDNPISKLIRWECECDCGNIIQINTGNLIYSNTRSCGCLRVDVSHKVNLKHGRSKSPIFNIWSAMKARCYYQKGKHYSDYGGRGIKVCDRWLNSFDEFYEDMGDRPTSKHSLDRIDVNGDYEPSNCRWATKMEQVNNTRKTLFLTYNGTTKSISDWSRFLGINKMTIRSRIQRGEKDMAKILSTKIHKNQFDVD